MIRVALLMVLYVAGVAALAYGAWLAYQPAGFVTAGALALWTLNQLLETPPLPEPPPRPRDDEGDE